MPSSSRFRALSPLADLTVTPRRPHPPHPSLSLAWPVAHPNVLLRVPGQREGGSTFHGTSCPPLLFFSRSFSSPLSLARHPRHDLLEVHRPGQGEGGRGGEVCGGQGQDPRSFIQADARRFFAKPSRSSRTVAKVGLARSSRPSCSTTTR